MIKEVEYFWDDVKYISFNYTQNDQVLIFIISQSTPFLLAKNTLQ